ncbi:MAG: hypothetical protein PHW82_13745 [Bacteroidales bacterium]|nr:hypothetical protein [Bacteroidales bacterium]
MERAIIAVPGFEQVFKKLDQQVALRGQSQSTLNNYIRSLGFFFVPFGKGIYLQSEWLFNA